jgi:hypothetical protein
LAELVEGEAGFDAEAAPVVLGWRVEEPSLPDEVSKGGVIGHAAMVRPPLPLSQRSFDGAAMFLRFRGFANR